MILVRDNSLPEISIVQVDKEAKKDGRYSKKEKWQHMPQLLANEIAKQSLNKYPKISPSLKKYAEPKAIEYMKSMYNISKKYDDSKMVLYNTASEAVVILIGEEISAFEENNTTKADSEFMETMINLGFYAKKDDDETFLLQLLRNQYVYQDDKIVNLTIYPTQACNARCFYCFEQKEQKIWMSEETADQIVDYITHTLTAENELVYRWFGGEPLLGVKIIDRIINGVDSFFEGKLTYHSVIITNNSLITDDLMEKFTTTWHVRKVQTTIDGYRQEHENRKAYVDKTVDHYQQTIDNIRKLLNAGIFAICRYNIDHFNKYQLPDVLEDLKEFKDNDHFFIHTTTLRNKCDPEEIARERYICPEDYCEFYDYVLNILFEKGFYKDVINILPIRARNVCLACVVGGLIINSEGKFFRCLQHSLNDDNCVGDCVNGLLHNTAYKKWFSNIDHLKSECERCKYLPCCQGGCTHYRIENKRDTSPCLREKFYIDIILDLVHKYVV